MQITNILKVNGIAESEIQLLSYLCSMAMIIYQYFKKELEEGNILVRINPENFNGLELLVDKDNNVLQTHREFDKTIYEDLKVDEFTQGNALEFNLYLNRISSNK